MGQEFGNECLRLQTSEALSQEDAKAGDDWMAEGWNHPKAHTHMSGACSGMTQRLGLLTSPPSSSLSRWLGFLTEWQPQVYYVAAQALSMTAPVNKAEPAPPFMTALKVTQHYLLHSLLVEAVTRQCRVKKREYRPYLSMGGISENFDILREMLLFFKSHFTSRNQ